MSPRVAAVVLFCLGAAGFVACSTPATDPRFVGPEPERASFEPVADMLVRNCGTLDCHGTAFRNLRIYGNGGLRWDKDPTASDASPSLLGKTTKLEYDEDYRSVIGLEPELTSKLFAERGASPERLTLVRKGRGQEAHKGGAVFPTGDPRDVCLTSWLAGAVDAAACAQAP